MLNKTFVQISITGLILLALFATPVSTRAGGRLRRHVYHPAGRDD